MDRGVRRAGAAAQHKALHSIWETLALLTLKYLSFVYGGQGCTLHKCWKIILNSRKTDSAKPQMHMLWNEHRDSGKDFSIPSGSSSMLSPSLRFMKEMTPFVQGQVPICHMWHTALYKPGFIVSIIVHSIEAEIFQYHRVLTISWLILPQMH